MTNNNERKETQITPESHLANAAHAAQSQANLQVGQQPGATVGNYLDHGTESLVAQDNPDDSQLGAPRDNKSQKKV